MRMVAEHITKPESAVSMLGRVLKPGGRVVVYTVHKWSPISMVSTIVPFGLHHHVKRVFWNTEERDTFPTAYKMNTRSELMKLFHRAGFREESFAYLDDCRASANFKWLNRIELSMWKALRAVNLHYPEVCMLAVYQKFDR